jgi:hypothetical protein
MSRITTILTAALVAGLAVACGSSGGSSTPTTQPTKTTQIRLAWNFTPNDNSGLIRTNDVDGNPCYVPKISTPTEYFYGAVMDGSVLIEDQSGTILAKTALPSEGATTNISPSTRTYTCTWTLASVDLPPATFYQVSMAGKRWAVIQASQIADHATTVVQLQPPT